MRGSCRGNLAILAVGELLTRGMSFVAFAHLARSLGTEGFGKLEFVLAWLMLGVQLIESGFQTIGAREVAIKRATVVPLATKIVPAQLSIALVAVIACLILHLSGCLDPITSRLMWGYSLSLFAVPCFLTWVFQGEQRMLWVALPQVLRYLVFLMLIVAWVESADDILWLPYAELISVAAAAGFALLVFFRDERHPTKDPSDAPELKSLIRDAGTIAASQLLWVVRMYFPIILLKFMMGDDSVGRFGAANRIVNVVLVAVAVYWMNYFPQLSQHAGRATLSSFLVRSLAISMLFMVGGAAICSLLAPQIMQVVFGAEFAGPTEATILAILVWRGPIMMFRSHARQALFVSKLQGLELTCSIASVAVLVPLSLLATHQSGVFGLTVAVVASELVGAVLTWLVWFNCWNQLRPLHDVGAN